MGRKDGIDVPLKDRKRIERKMDEYGWTNEELGRRVDRVGSTIGRLLNEGRTSRSTLQDVGRVLDLEFPKLLPQLEFELEIGPEFVANARAALESEMERLRGEVGTASEKRVTASVALMFYGVEPTRRAVERRFTVTLGKRHTVGD